MSSITEKDLIDEDKIKYGKYSNWHSDNCKVSTIDYDIEVVIMNHYKKIEDIRYILIENFNYKENDLKIYNNSSQIEYEIISNENNILKIDLKKAYLAETLLFYIDANEISKIGLYSTYDFSKELLAKEIKKEKIFIPDKTWITAKTNYIKLSTEETLKNSDLTTKTGWNYLCRNRKKYIYKYEIIREYYDGNYHLDVEGYKKDIYNYKIFYKGKPMTNTIEIIQEKIIKEIQTQYEYIYLENENNTQKNDSSQKINCEPIIKREIIEKEIFQIPKVIYIGIIILVATIIFLVIKIYKKYVI